MEYLLLAERLRVEERLLIEAFDSIGCTARLLTPAEIGSIQFGDVRGSNRFGLRPEAGTIISRLHPTREASALLWALESVGWTVVPGASQMDVFSRRDRLYRELSRAGVPVVETVLGWGASAIMSAVDATQFPVELLPLDGGEAGIVVEDREGAEAVVEHRAVLGREHVLLVRHGAALAEHRRLLIAGGEVIAALPSGEADWTVDPVKATDLEIASRVSTAVGAPLIDMSYLPCSGNAVTTVMPLLNFRSVQSEQSDVAAAIASCVGRTEAVHG
jgi:[lysine-biosynthesis-protein LysW]---L-2-aminoadipate ligase